MVGPPIVILLSRPGEDPRAVGAKDARTVSFRVALQRHHDPVRVVVEIEDGQDGIGTPRWHRIDNGEPGEARAAYEVLERLTAEYYERFTVAEDRAVKAERGEAAAKAQPRAASMPVPRLAIPDARTKAREKLDDLLELAGRDNTPTEEARNAAVAAVRLMRDHKMAPR